MNWRTLRDAAATLDEMTDEDREIVLHRPRARDALAYRNWRRVCAKYFVACSAAQLTADQAVYQAARYHRTRASAVSARLSALRSAVALALLGLQRLADAEVEVRRLREAMRETE
jgi:hypothetical protein